MVRNLSLKYKNKKIRGIKSAIGFSERLDRISVFK